MIVKDLIELNDYIGDIIITVRSKRGLFRKEYSIGLHEGNESSNRANKEYIPVIINDFDNGKPRYRTLLSKIPSELLKLDVQCFSVRKATRMADNDMYFGHFLECISIGCLVETDMKDTKSKGKPGIQGEMEQLSLF